ncbi:hypothetical protein H6G74_06030 [Nostoc spongiaeforme FACHB-130]|uniref:Uncharacterized protein n=1 Tax=Nostoc spongiaeforme FACHB-130 TaxID=1357510 RepID=A0ABR8FR24_9NOSO|nr:hypothetical protein [Nostoc spongiaeforme]MBD2593888.1 hypothetical protein [Nostoc spongiaeforme FACHB-130]
MLLQIIDLENNELFSEISNEESASVSGGLTASYAFAAALTAGIFAVLIALGVNSLGSEFHNPVAESLSQPQSLDLG